MRALLSDRAGLAVFAGALIVYILALMQFWQDSPFATNLILDAYRHEQTAHALLAGGFPWPDPFHQAPLYPHLLAIALAVGNGSLALVFVLQAVLGAASVLLLYRIGRRHLGRRVGVIAALLATFSLPLIAFSSRVLPEVLVVFLELLFLDRLPDREERAAGRWIVPGLLVGFLALARPTHLFLVAWAGALFALRRLSPAALGTFALATAVVVAPATLHNAARGGGFVPVASNGGETFYHGNNPRAAGGYAPMAGLESTDILKQATISRELAEARTGRAMNAAEVSRHWFAEGLAFAGEDPLRYLRLVLAKLRLALGGGEAPDIYSPSLEAERYTPIYKIGFARLPFILPLALAGLVALGRRPSTWFVALLVMHTTTLLGFYVSNRYRLPLEVLLLLPAALALVRLRERQVRLALVAGIAVLVAVLATSDAEETQAARGKVLVNLGASFGKQGDYAAAEAAFRDAIAEDSSWSRAHHYLGRTLALQRRNDEALTAYARAITLAPDVLDPRLDYVQALARAGRTDEALTQLAAADSLAAANGIAATRTRIANLRESLERAGASGGPGDDD